MSETKDKCDMNLVYLDLYHHVSFPILYVTVDRLALWSYRGQFLITQSDKIKEMS